MFVLLLTEKELETLKCSLNADFFDRHRRLKKLEDLNPHYYKTSIRHLKGYLKTVRDIQIKVDELRRNKE